MGLVLTLGVFAIFNERFYFFLRNSLTHERFVPYLVIHVLWTTLGSRLNQLSDPHSSGGPTETHVTNPM